MEIPNYKVWASTQMHILILHTPFCSFYMNIYIIRHKWATTIGNFILAPVWIQTHNV